ncbi:MAG: ATP-binding cassette domain-containing protein [Verrucomicrobia bacterium]|nr:ATP-binding cassette domain-containing protein [Verrucomicrobiota bacterium]
MIQVDNLVKRYAGFTAIHGLTFSVQKGEIVGFLGPNGAGKSTTMRILSCFMPATSGTAIVAGFNTYDQSLEVRQRIGYMPENVPLYPEMRVHEYLHFRAALKGVPRSRRRGQVERVSEQCGITDVMRKIIGHLSKGYRQRVGLADALVHDPELIILDEPTIGLDPNQIRQVRGLIKDLGKSHTVLLSTHILPEVEMTCSRVIIINKGKIAASDTPENLKRLRMGGGETVVEVKADAKAVENEFRAIPDVSQVEASPSDGGFCKVAIHPKRDEDLRETVYQIVRQKGWGLRELTRRRQTLEDVFVQITTEDD